jgi:hypothetical protein
MLPHCSKKPTSLKDLSKTVGEKATAVVDKASSVAEDTASNVQDAGQSAIDKTTTVASKIDPTNKSKSSKTDEFSLSINDNKEFSNNPKVTLTSKSLAGKNPTEMYITNDPGCETGGSYEPFAATRTDWPVGQIGVKTSVYAKYRSPTDGESACYSASIHIDQTAPTFAGSLDVAKVGATATGA